MVGYREVYSFTEYPGMLIYSPLITPRLNYVADFSGKELTGRPAAVTSNAGDFLAYDGVKINYSHQRIADSELWICPHHLLFETGIKEQPVDCFEWHGTKAFFKTEGDVEFDIFAASFYLLSRYEEYLVYKKDMYGRYAHENSLAFKENFLNIPLVNIWLQQFRIMLQTQFPGLPAGQAGSQFRIPQFTFLPTYDIDEAFCYKYKSWWRTWGGCLRSVFKRQWWEVKERSNVLKDRMNDPYDSFEWIKELHYLRRYLDAFFLYWWQKKPVVMIKITHRTIKN
ncbi:MAG: hypothetical protein FJY20_01370 [Bacteroidetes bacterium]|nr:hypothetical protein [Bacteroidota bacterium]